MLQGSKSLFYIEIIRIKGTNIYFTDPYIPGPLWFQDDMKSFQKLISQYISLRNHGAGMALVKESCSLLWSPWASRWCLVLQWLLLIKDVGRKLCLPLGLAVPMDRSLLLTLRAAHWSQYRLWSSGEVSGLGPIGQGSRLLYTMVLTKPGSKYASQTSALKLFTVWCTTGTKHEPSPW